MRRRAVRTTFLSILVGAVISVPLFGAVHASALIDDGVISARGGEGGNARGGDGDPAGDGGESIGGNGGIAFNVPLQAPPLGPQAPAEEPEEEAGPILQVTKVCTTEGLSPGRANCEATVTNVGGAAAEGVSFNDPVPGGVSLLGTSSGCTESGGIVTCDLGTLQPGDSGSLDTSFFCDSEGTVTNTAEATSSNAASASDSDTFDCGLDQV